MKINESSVVDTIGSTRLMLNLIENVLLNSEFDPESKYHFEIFRSEDDQEITREITLKIYL